MTASHRPTDPRTIAARIGVDQDSAHGAVMPPLYLSSNYSFAGFDQKRQYDYSRSGNPTRDVLAETLAELEGGAGAVVVATGMAAVDLAFCSLEPGDLLIAPHDCYGGTHRLLCARAAFQFRQGLGQHVAGRVARAAVVVLPLLVEAGEGVVGRQVQRRHDRAVRRILIDADPGGDGAGVGRTVGSGHWSMSFRAVVSTSATKASSLRKASWP